MDSSLNLADLGTQGQVGLKALGSLLVWQSGPAFLTLLVNDWWKASSSMAREMRVPPEEIRKLSHDTLLASSKPPCRDLAVEIGQAVVGGTKLGEAVSGMITVVLQREKLELSVHALTRALSAVVVNDRELCHKAPTESCTNLAVYLSKAHFGRRAN